MGFRRKVDCTYFYIRTKVVRIFPTFNVFIDQKSIFHCYFIRNVKDVIQIQVYNINNDSVNHFSQSISVKVKKNLRKSQVQFREMFKKN